MERKQKAGVMEDKHGVLSSIAQNVSSKNNNKEDKKLRDDSI